MRLVCPDCMGTLVPDGSGAAQCDTHGGQYQVLFARSPAPPSVPVPGAITRPAPRLSPSELDPSAPPPIYADPQPPVAYHLVPGATCAKHRSVAARFACCQCGAPICDTCAFPEGDGRAVCPDCVVRRMGANPTAAPPSPTSEVAAPIPADARCVQHPNQPAVQQCRVCSRFMCSTCDFILPGNVHVCPACAAAPNTGLSPRRKKMLLGAFALAAWATMGMAAMVAGVFASHSKAAQQAIGMLLMLIVLGPSVTGLALGLSARERRLDNPPAIMIAIVWNALIVGSFLMLCIIGLARS